MLNSGVLYYNLPWQELISQDVHIMDSVLESMNNCSKSDDVSCCEFFIDVVLHDFPAEVFLQRPAIIMVTIL